MLGGSCGFDTNQLIATAHQWAKSMPSIIIIIGNVYWTNYCEWWKAVGWWVLLHTGWKIRKNTHLNLTLLWQKLSWKQRFSYWRNTWKKNCFHEMFSRWEWIFRFSTLCNTIALKATFAPWKWCGWWFEYDMTISCISRHVMTTTIHFWQ